MLKTIYLHTFLFFFFLFSCKNEQKKNQNFFSSPNKISGNWVNQSFLTSVKERLCIGKILQENKNQPYTELFFAPELGDSALIFTPTNRFKCHYQWQNDQLVLDNASQNGQPLNLNYDPAQNRLKLATDRNNSYSSADFVAADSFVVLKSGVKEAFSQAFNRQTVAGVYTDSLSGRDVAFDLHGKVEGLEEYEEYETCLGGDCDKIIDGAADAIFMSKDGRGSYFAWQYAPNNPNTLIIWDIAPLRKGIRTGRRLVAPRYVLKRNDEL
ncbi:MAG: hypothetical protein RLZZ292_2216 [Bacteroidota bacterium]